MSDSKKYPTRSVLLTMSSSHKWIYSHKVLLYISTRNPLSHRLSKISIYSDISRSSRLSSCFLSHCSSFHYFYPFLYFYKLISIRIIYQSTSQFHPIYLLIIQIKTQIYKTTINSSSHSQYSAHRKHNHIDLIPNTKIYGSRIHISTKWQS